MRVCLISSYPPKASGIGTYTTYLEKELRKNVKVQVLPWNYDGFFAKLLSPIINRSLLSQAMQKNDIVHVQYHLGDFQFMFLPVLCLLKSKARLVLTLHEDYTNLCCSFIITWFHLIFYRCTDLLILHTKEQKKVLSSILRRKAVVIPHGVIYRRVKRNPKKNTILLPGFVNPWKGHDLAVKALPLVLREVGDAKLIIVGKAHNIKYGDSLKRLVQKEGVADYVVIIDRYVRDEEMYNYLSEADIVVLPYRRITMSGILCHVLSWHVPAVISDIKVLREFTRGNALYCRVGDHDDLARQIASLLTRYTKKRRMSHQFRELSQQMSWQNVARRTAQCYKRIHKH
jgi:glycosyltransferase involved in cell wall biosynthesis